MYGSCPADEVIKQFVQSPVLFSEPQIEIIQWKQ